MHQYEKLLFSWAQIQHKVLRPNLALLLTHAYSWSSSTSWQQPPHSAILRNAQRTNSICLRVSTKLAGNSFGDNDWQFLAFWRCKNLFGSRSPPLFCSNWPQNAPNNNDTVAKFFEPRKITLLGGMNDVLPSQVL